MEIVALIKNCVVFRNALTCYKDIFLFSHWISAKSAAKKHSDIFFGRESSVDGSSNFCDDEYAFYGQIEELKLWCDPIKGQVKGLTARHGPKPGESKYAWSMVHGSSNDEPENEKWLLWGHNISEVILVTVE